MSTAVCHFTVRSLFDLQKKEKKSIWVCYLNISFSMCPSTRHVFWPIHWQIVIYRAASSFMGSTNICALYAMSTSHIPSVVIFHEYPTHITTILYTHEILRKSNKIIDTSRNCHISRDVRIWTCIFSEKSPRVSPFRCRYLLGWSREVFLWPLFLWRGEKWNTAALQGLLQFGDQARNYVFF